MTSHDVWVFLFVLLCIPHMPLVLYMQAFVFFLLHRHRIIRVSISLNAKYAATHQTKGQPRVCVWCMYMLHCCM